MRVKDAGGRIFNATKKNEKGKMEMSCKGTAFGVNYAFDPPVPSEFKVTGDNGVLKFSITHDTELILNFNFSKNTGGEYECALTHIDGDSDGIFPETVIQFELFPERRRYAFLERN